MLVHDMISGLRETTSTPFVYRFTSSSSLSELKNIIGDHTRLIDYLASQESSTRFSERYGFHPVQVTTTQVLHCLEGLSVLVGSKKATRLPRPVVSTYSSKIGIFLQRCLLLALSVISLIALATCRSKFHLLFLPKKGSGEYGLDFRADHIIRECRAKGISYAVFCHGPIGAKTTYNLTMLGFRGIPVVDISALDFLKNIIPIQLNYTCPEFIDQKKFSTIINIISNELRLILLRTFIFKISMYLGRVELAKTLDTPRYWAPLCIAAKSMGVYSIAYQHGIYSKRQVGFQRIDGVTSYTHTDRLTVKNLYWLRKLMELNSYFDPNSVSVSRTISTQSVQNQTSSSPRTPSLLVCVFERRIDYAKMAPFVVAVAKQNGLKIALKVRNDLDPTEQLTIYFGSNYSEMGITAIDSLGDPLDCILIGLRSSYLYDLFDEGFKVITPRGIYSGDDWIGYTAFCEIVESIESSIYDT